MVGAPKRSEGEDIRDEFVIGVKNILENDALCMQKFIILLFDLLDGCLMRN